MDKDSAILAVEDSEEHKSEEAIMDSKWSTDLEFLICAVKIDECTKECGAQANQPTNCDWFGSNISVRTRSNNAKNAFPLTTQ